MFKLRQDIGVDLGTATVLIYVKGKGIVLREPSVAAVDRITGRLFAVGYEAQRMIGRTPGNIVAVRPLRDGVISDYDVTEKMLRAFLEKVSYSKLFKPNMMICVPSGVTDVEERAVKDAAIRAGGRAYIIEEPIAAAIGAGIDISEPNGNMIVDIGGGTSDIAVISLGGVVVSSSIKVAGDKFDDAIVKYIRKTHNVLIGERMAAEIKHNIGCVFLDGREEKVAEVKGRNLVTGLPKVFNVTSTEIYDALIDTAKIIVDAVHQTLEKTPPELVGDIATGGIIMTGGGSLLDGLCDLIYQKTGIKAVVADDPNTCVALGTGKSLEQIGLLSDSSNSVAGRKYFDI